MVAKALFKLEALKDSSQQPWGATDFLFALDSQDERSNVGVARSLFSVVSKKRLRLK